MKVLTGTHQKNSVDIRIDGAKVFIKNPYNRKRLGIIYQEFFLVPDISVADNVYIQHFQ